MAKMENVQAGVAKFIDRDIAPSLSGWDRVIIAAGGGILASRLPDILAQYAEKPIFAAMPSMIPKAETWTLMPSIRPQSRIWAPSRSRSRFLR